MLCTVGENVASRDVQIVDAVYEVLKRRIITGRYAPEEPLAQLRIAEELGISRTPLREVFRLLEQHGLVVSEHNKRFRVAGFSATDLDELYALRISVEGLAARVGIPLLTDTDLDHLRTLVGRMDSAVDNRDYERWNEPHIDFHRMLISRSGTRSVNLARQLSDHAERYRYASTQPQLPASWEQGRADHAALLAAAEDRDGERACSALAAHYGRVALSVLSLSAPMHEPRHIRQSMASCGLDRGPFPWQATAALAAPTT
jgi:DNA-binding GntR family transcriptional regulator